MKFCVLLKSIIIFLISQFADDIPEYKRAMHSNIVTCQFFKNLTKHKKVIDLKEFRNLFKKKKLF